MIVFRPSKNTLTQSYSSTHKGYDFDDVPIKEYCASEGGSVLTVVNSWDKSWIANKPGDPWYVAGKNRPLKTEDYGNYLRIKLDNGLIQLASHFPKNGIIVKVGERVKAGQVVGFAPDTNTDTGNSTGGHTHTEYRDASNTSIQVSFKTELPPQEEPMSKLLTYLGMESEEAAIARLDEHLGTSNGKCDWGTDQEGRGGHLGASRRRVKQLESQPVSSPSNPPEVPGWKVNGLQVSVGSQTWNYEKA